MNERFQIVIGGVDGETNVSMECTQARTALMFLKRFDHEGSSIMVTIIYDDPDTAYRAINVLANDHDRLVARRVEQEKQKP